MRPEHRDYRLDYWVVLLTFAGLIMVLRELISEWLK